MDTMSPTIGELAKALNKAQADIGSAKKDGTNPHFRSKFATLESVIDVLKGPLYVNGLAYVQQQVHHADGIGLRTMLMHTSGEWLAATAVLPIDRQKGRTDVQAAGSTITVDVSFRAGVPRSLTASVCVLASRNIRSKSRNPPTSSWTLLVETSS